MATLSGLFSEISSRYLHSKSPGDNEAKIILSPSPNGINQSIIKQKLDIHVTRQNKPERKSPSTTNFDSEYNSTLSFVDLLSVDRKSK